MSNITSAFASIKKALEQDKSTGGAGDFLKTEPGNTYTVRLLPAKDASKTFFHYYQHGWTSFSTGEYVGALSLQTFNQRDPISEDRYRIIRTGDETAKKKAETIRRAEKWLVNVYVVNDPVKPENNGTVKILRYGKQLQTVIQDAIDGESAEELGSKIFDLSNQGVSLKIKVDKQGEFPSYVASKFSMPGEIKGLTEDKIEKIYGSVFDLTGVIPARSVEELKQMLAEHFYCTTVKDEVEEEKNEPVKESPKASKKTAPVDSDDEVEKLLADLNTN
jgi:hypothetical protein